MNQKFQILEGSKIHLSVIPKLGSTAIRNLYCKSDTHRNSSHIDKPPPIDDSKIVFFTKDIHEVFFSSIFTDLESLIMNSKILPDWIQNLDNSIKILYFTTFVRFDYVTQIKNIEKEINSDKYENISVDSFHDFCKDIIDTFFSFDDNSSWIYEGHILDTISEVPKLLQLKDRLILTPISSINNVNFMNWLIENDRVGWSHLKDVDLSNKKMEYSFKSENHTSNIFNV